jgi:3-dehydroquinate synthase
MQTAKNIGEVRLSTDLILDLKELTAGFPEHKIFMVFESNTWASCRTRVIGFRNVPEENILVLKPGEDNKNISQVIEVWEHLGKAGADRHSLVINVGGGMLTDLGGFAACTFKRGLAFINIPTTLLAMVDASTGGKTGINFRGLKNEIGVIRQPKNVLIHMPFLRTLDRENLLSGYAEMLKAGLIADRQLWDRLKAFDMTDMDEEILEELIWQSIGIKKRVVDEDPEERGIRKALNFGHTIGHALESEALHAGQPLPHGFAVAFGMITEAILSNRKCGLSPESVSDIRETVIRLYGEPPVTMKESDPLLGWMRFDKKNRDNTINFTLLDEIGSCRINQAGDDEEIREVLRLTKP